MVEEHVPENLKNIPVGMIGNVMHKNVCSQVAGGHGAVDPIQGQGDARIDARKAGSTTQAPRSDSTNHEEAVFFTDHGPTTIPMTCISDTGLRKPRSTKHRIGDATVVLCIFLGTKFMLESGD